ncbi:MAG TPA: sigma-70 family RNA polymerase sigma factor, partial [Longimicrobiales bacterium]|nr:sigma-70 family RNA polymerase sigma factor [Longimicrobiales bacterium]
MAEKAAAGEAAREATEREATERTVAAGGAAGGAGTAGADDADGAQARGRRAWLPPGSSREMVGVFGESPDSDALDHYFREIQDYTPMPREREVELGRRAREGDQEALDELVRANLRFAISEAKRYQNRGLPLEDLIQEANAGMVRAAQKFDPESGHKFITYAVWWVRQSIRKALTEQAHAVRLPLGRRAELFKVRKARRSLKRKLGYPPTRKQVAEETGLTERVVRALEQVGAPEVQLDATVGEEGDAAVGERIALADEEGAEVAIEDQQVRAMVESALGELRERDAF